MNKLIAQEYASAKGIQDLAIGDKRELTDEELDTIEAHIKKAEELEITQKRTDELNAKLNFGIDKMTQVQPRKSVSVPQISVSEPNFTKDSAKGFKTPREFFQAVMDEKLKAKTDERLKFLAVVGSDEHQTLDDPYGGFLVPEAFTPDLLRVAPEDDFTAGRTTQVPMSAPTIRIPARVDKNHNTSVSGGLTVSRNTETVSATASRMKFEQIALSVNDLTGASFVSSNLMQDSPISVASLLAQGFQDEFTSVLIDEKLNGTGAGQYEGITNSGAFITQAKETAQIANTIVVANILKMRSRVWGYQNAIWIANHDCLPQLAQLNDNTNHVWLPSVREDVPDSLMGRPLIFTEYTNTLGSANDIICVNWSQYLEGTYQQLQSAESIHVRFLNRENTFLFAMRNDGKSWWTAPLTPKKSAKTLSPFVGLAVRA